MKFNDFLKHIGFSDQESIIYLTLLERGFLSISNISKFTRINRVAIYNLIPSLLQKGVISEIKKGSRNLYKAENPEKLSYIRDRQTMDFNKKIIKLKGIYKNQKNRPLIKFLDGESAIDNVFNDVVESLPKGSTFYRYSSKRNSDKVSKKLNTNYYKLRDTKKLERLVITSESKGGIKKPKLERFIKTIPKEYDLFEDNVSQIIYGNKIAFVDYNTQTSFIIESKEITKFQKKIFKLLWNKL